MVVNADSAQVYRDLPILTAAPAIEELMCAEYRLYGIRDGTLPWSAADWAAAARREIADVHSQRRVPVLVGGTGLYLRTLLEGIAPVPPIDSKLRKRVRDGSVEHNREQLARLDCEAATRLKAGDAARIARALEVVLSTGRTLSEWQKQREGGIADEVELHPIVLLPPRDWLYQRCDERFERMVQEGAIEEVKTLLSRHLNPNLPIMRAIGVREITAYLAGQLPLGKAIAAGQQATRRYAKRQYTWFAHQPPSDWPRFREPLEGIHVSEALAMLQRGLLP